ncbi:MAG: hypothetical protein ACM3UU_01460 [Ignavibacteriales bacterium]
MNYKNCGMTRECQDLGPQCNSNNCPYTGRIFSPAKAVENKVIPVILDSSNYCRHCNQPDNYCKCYN